MRDATQDARAQDNPLVAGVPAVRFYAAAPLRTHDGFNLGTLSVIDRVPRELAPDEAEAQEVGDAGHGSDGITIGRPEARRTGRAQHGGATALRQRSAQASEERFRDLFDEAPIAYVHEGLDSRFIQANQTAMRILGLKPEEVAGTFGRSLVPETSDAQHRLRGGSNLSDAARTPAAECSKCVVKTTATQYGCSGGRARRRRRSHPHDVH